MIRIRKPSPSSIPTSQTVKKVIPVGVLRLKKTQTQTDLHPVITRENSTVATSIPSGEIEPATITKTTTPTRRVNSRPISAADQARIRNNGKGGCSSCRARREARK